jgi:prepilin-type N-terminal cleavage/methylation domain-containing protein
MRRAGKQRAFSLVELVIVVVIIGVIAAIAVPRISRGAKGAGESAVRGSLAALRNAIDMYSAEHGGAFPGADNDEDTFINQLTKKTSVGGLVGTTATVHIFGPYLRGGVPPLPVGPNKGAREIFLAGTGPVVDETKTDVGWIYNSVTGDVIANSDDKDESDVEYSKY